MSGPVIAGLGTIFGGAGAAATTAGILGSVVAGIGSGLMARAKERAAERSRREEEKRREARWEGAGEAAFGGPQQDPAAVDQTAVGVEHQRARGQKGASTPLGFREVTQRIGDNQPTAPAGSSRFTYDKDNSKIAFK